MSRTIMRGSKMDRPFQMRFHEEDLANLKLAAQSAGKDVSAFIRDLLIKEKVINPIWLNYHDKNWKTI